MPALRIIYVSDHDGRAKTVTAHFASRDAALTAFSAEGLRVLQIGEMQPGERATDPVTVRMAAAAEAPAHEERVRGLVFGTAH